MIRSSEGWIHWDEEDVVPMVRIIGPDEASREKTRLNSVVLKEAKRRGIQMSRRLEQRLEDAIELRSELKPIKREKDWSVPSLRRLGYDPRITRRLFPHQRVLLRFIEDLDAYLIRDQPGVGKTAPAILWAEQRAESRILVVTPNSAKYQWEDEIRRWAQYDFPVSILDGTIPQQNRIAQKNGWIIAHWEALVHARRGILKKDWDVVILDEGHAIRNRDTKRANIAHLLAKVTDNRLILTAHPYVKRPDELFSLLQFLWPDDYTSYWRFFSMHVLAKPKHFGGFDIIGTRDPKLLRWELDPFTIGRKKSDVFKSTPVTRIPRHIDLPKKYQKDYKSLRKEFFATLTGRERRLPILNVLSRTTRLRQFLVDPGLLGSKLPSLKYPIVAELLEELDGPPVIFTSFRQAAERLHTFLRKRGYRTGIVAGKVEGKKQGPKARFEVQRRFHQGIYDAVIIVTQAGGTALNFGKYGYVIYLDLPWTAKDLEQTEGRVDRPDATTGQVIHTTAYRIVVRGTYEQKIEAKIEDTFQGFNEVFDPKQLETLF